MSKDTRPIVLVANHTPDNLKIMSGLLKDLYRVKIANGGEKALAIAVADPRPDLILLDIMMPEVDGYEVCQQLKADADQTVGADADQTVGADADQTVGAVVCVQAKGMKDAWCLAVI